MLYALCFISSRPSSRLAGAFRLPLTAYRLLNRLLGPTTVQTAHITLLGSILLSVFPILVNNLQAWLWPARVLR